jgi:HSP20 family protein
MEKTAMTTQAEQSQPNHDQVVKLEEPSPTSGRLARNDISTLSSRAFLPSPFSLMSEFMFDLDRVLRGFVTGSGSAATRPGLRVVSSAEALWSPPIEVLERDGQLLIRADIPGLSKDEIAVEVDGDRLVISGERTQQVEEKEAGFIRSERIYGSFSRAIGLPEGADADQAKVTFHDGVLEVIMPLQRDDQAKKRRLEIATSDGSSQPGGENSANGAS